ncbi:unnamed protein product [Caenorhabditis brenneri]
MLKIPVRAAVRFGWSYWRNNTGETNGEPQHRRHSWALRVRESIVLFTIILLVKPMHGCQEVEVINQATKECILNENEKKCTFFTENIIHLNQVQREACIRMNHNGTTFQELRAKFVETKLRCLKESVVFTKDVEIKVWSTKRCPHMGSCTDEKCAKINRTSRIPELEHTHGYVGTTACVESCGGPGCDCFFPSSACLFYRIYAVPKSNDIFEVFKCIEWSKSMKIHVTTTTLNSKTNEAEKNKVELLLNQPVSIDGHTITASSIITTPSPILDTWFIRNGTDTATWSNLQLPAFQCYSEQLAIGNNCQLNAPCQCAPIESEVRCTCPDHNLTEHFNTIQYRLPIQKGHWKLTRQEDSVIATSGEEISTEIVIRSEGEADIEIMKDEDQCSVEADHITGCYSCAEGGQEPAIGPQSIRKQSTPTKHDRNRSDVYNQRLRMNWAPVIFACLCMMSHSVQQQSLKNFTEMSAGSQPMSYRRQQLQRLAVSLKNRRDKANDTENEFKELVADRTRIIAGWKTRDRTPKCELMNEILRKQIAIDTRTTTYRKLQQEFQNDLNRLEEMVRYDVFKRGEIDDELFNRGVWIEAWTRQFQEELELMEEDKKRINNEMTELLSEVEIDMEQDRMDKRNLAHRLELYGKLIHDRLWKLEQLIQKNLPAPAACSRESTPEVHVISSDLIKDIATEMNYIDDRATTNETRTERSRSSSRHSSKSRETEFSRTKDSRTPSPRRERKRSMDRRSQRSRQRNRSDSRSPKRHDYERNKGPVVRIILRPNEDRHLCRTKCVFCGDKHLSNECGNIPTIDERRRIIEDTKRCVLCLNKHFPNPCNKQRARCGFCVRSGYYDEADTHHASLCARPTNRFERQH